MALTAYARPEDAQRCREAGCTTHLGKPVRKAQLIQTIMVLEGRPRDRILVRVDPELVAAIPGFLEHRRRDVASLREAFERGDFEAIRVVGRHA